MSNQSFNALHNLLPAGSIQLGYFVLFPHEPLRAYFNIPGGPPPPSLRSEATSAADFNARSNAAEGSISLGHILALGCGLKSDTSVDLEAASSVTQSLDNYDNWFDEACRSPELRKWFEKHLEKYGSKKLRLHLVIGLQTIKDASLVLKSSSTVEARLTGRLPLSEILGDPGVVSPLLAPGASADIALIRASGQKFSVVETLYAVKYAQVKFTYLSSRKLARLLNKLQLPKSSLETYTRWVVMGTDTGGPSVSDEDRESGDEHKDMIEATIEATIETSLWKED